MSDITSQVIMTLSASMQEAARQAANNATFVRYYSGIIIEMTGIGRYRVAVANATPDLPVYGSGAFQLGDKCWVVAPNNENDFSNMFILGAGMNIDKGLTEEKVLLNQLKIDVDSKVDKADITGEPGLSDTKIMHQLAVTHLIESKLEKLLKGVKVNGTIVPQDEDHYIDLGIATTEVLGLVKSSNSENQIKVNATSGVMEVNSMDVMRLVQHNGDLLVFESGRADTER